MHFNCKTVEAVEAIAFGDGKPVFAVIGRNSECPEAVAVFSTEEAANDWMKLNGSSDDIVCKVTVPHGTETEAEAEAEKKVNIVVVSCYDLDIWEAFALSDDKLKELDNIEEEEIACCPVSASVFKAVLDSGDKVEETF